MLPVKDKIYKMLILTKRIDKEDIWVETITQYI